MKEFFLYYILPIILPIFSFWVGWVLHYLSDRPKKAKPEYRIVERGSFIAPRLYQVQQRGILWGWNDVFHHNGFPDYEDAVKQIPKLRRAVKPDVVITTHSKDEEPI